MAPPLNNQTLKYVESALSQHPGSYSTKLLEILSNGSFHAFNEAGRKELKPAYGHGGRDTPSFAGHSSMPWTHLPSLDEIQKILDLEISNGRVKVVPRQPTEFLQRLTAEDLLRNLHVPDYNGPADILHLTSDYLDRLLVSNVKFGVWKNDVTFLKSTPGINILPSQHSLDLGHFEGSAYSSLIAGVKLWMIFPPTKDNMDILLEKWLAVGQDPQERDIFPFVKRMSGGVVVVQSAGQTLHIPPCCPKAAWTLETCVSVEHGIMTAKQFPLFLQCLPVTLESAKYQFAYAQEKDANLLGLAQTTGKLLHLILNFPQENFNPSKTISKICQIGDTGFANLQVLCEAINDETLREQYVANFKYVWMQHLELKRKKSPICRICNLRLSDWNLSVADHFEFDHWTVGNIDVPDLGSNLGKDFDFADGAVADGNVNYADAGLLGVDDENHDLKLLPADIAGHESTGEPVFPAVDWIGLFPIFPQTNTHGGPPDMVDGGSNGGTVDMVSDEVNGEAMNFPAANMTNMAPRMSDWASNGGGLSMAGDQMDEEYARMAPADMNIMANSVSYVANGGTQGLFSGSVVEDVSFSDAYFDGSL